MATILMAQWYWGYINSDIAPLESIPTPMYRQAQSVFEIVSTTTPLYNSAVYQTPQASSRDYAGIWFFDSEPTITVTNYAVSRFPFSKWTDGTYWCVATSIVGGDNAGLHDYTVPFYDNRTDFLDYVTTPQVPPIVYTWQSVPSISGKNGILSLVTLDSESINDGEPVSGAAVSVFDQAPSIDNNIKNLADTYGGGEESSAVDVTVKYKVTLPPGGSFSVLKLVAKKDSIPEDASDGDKIVDISPSKTKKTVTGLDENSMYYFKIFAEDSNGSTSESNEKHIATSGDEGWTFDYTGEIQTFVAPKTGIYLLETWGAQGGDASDGTLTARGGYGAYAVGEVFLTQGETLYINVGGQDGYGGGGKILVTENIPISIINKYYVSSNSGGQIPYEVPTTYPDIISYLGTDYCIVIGDTNKKKLDVENDYIKYDNDNYSCSTGEMIPIPHKVIRNVKFKYKKVSSSIPAYWWFDFMLLRINTETGVYGRGLTITDDQSQSASSDWVSVDYDCNFEANYIHIWGVTGKWYVKDLQITYEQ